MDIPDIASKSFLPEENADWMGRMVIKAVEQTSGISYDLLMDGRRYRDKVEWKVAAVCVFSDLCKVSFARTARAFRDKFPPSSVYYLRSKGADWYRYDKGYRSKYDRVREMVEKDITESTEFL